MGDVGKSQSKTNGKLSPLLKTKSFYDNNAKKINGRRPKYHNRSTSKSAIKLNDSVTQESAPNVNQESSSDDCKILQQKLNNPSIINLPARANARPSGSDISQNSGKNRKRAASLTHTENSSLSVKEFSPPVAQAAKNLRKPRTYNPSEVIAKLNKQLILSGHKFSERQIELIENQISEERRELMKIYRQLIAQKKKHQQLLQEDTKIENILDKEKSQEIQSFMPKQKLQKIESEIFLATISGPNYDESVRSYKDYIAAISISTYPVLGGVRAGDPICDFYYARLFEQGTIFALADGCNWGEAPKQAAQRAANTFVHYIQDRLYRLSDTKQVTKEILKAFAASHGAIMMGSGDTDFFQIGTATLIGGALLPLAPKPKTESTTISSSHSADPLPESNVSLESKNLNSPQKRRRRKTAELPQISNSISKQEDFIRPVIPKSRRKHRKSSGGSMLKNITSTNELQLKLDPTPAPISTKPQPRSGEFGSAPELYLLSELDPILVESPRESAPARSKRKKCMRKLSPRRNSEEPPNTQQMIVNSENPESNTTVSSSDSSAKTNTSDNPLSTPNSNSNSNSNDNNAQSPVDSGLGEQEDTLQKSILSPVIRNSEEREWSPLSNRRRSSRKVSISPEVAQSPGRHRSCTHYGYAGLNDRATNTSPVMDVSKSDGTNDWAFVFGSVGDCKVFLFNPTDQTVTDITSSNRSNSMSAADCGGRLGPCDKSGKPDLRNLSVVSATVQEGDLIILVSDGVHDNLDPELLGKTPFELSSLVNEKATWDDIPVEEATSLKNTFREQKLAELLNQLPTRTPKNICKTLANYAKGITQSSRTFMETNPALELPSDFTKYPGKMDHTSCICIQVGSRSNRSDINLVRDAFIRKETMSITHN